MERPRNRFRRYRFHRAGGPYARRDSATGGAFSASSLPASVTPPVSTSMIINASQSSTNNPSVTVVTPLSGSSTEPTTSNSQAIVSNLREINARLRGLEEKVTKQNSAVKELSDIIKKVL